VLKPQHSNESEATRNEKVALQRQQIDEAKATSYISRLLEVQSHQCGDLPRLSVPQAVVKQRRP